jgi:hypothetical protein
LGPSSGFPVTRNFRICLLDLTKASDLSITAEQIPWSFLDATNIDAEKVAREGRFKLKFCYRLNLVPLILSPLKTRKETMLIVARYCADAKGNSGSEQKCRMGAIPHRLNSVNRSGVTLRKKIVFLVLVEKTGLVQCLL